MGSQTSNGKSKYSDDQIKKMGDDLSKFKQFMSQGEIVKMMEIAKNNQVFRAVYERAAGYTVLK